MTPLLTHPATSPVSKRFVSLWLPHLAIENHKRQQPEPCQTAAKHRPGHRAAPFALVDNTSKGLRLSAVDEQAEKQGLVPDMPLSDALALCPLLQTRKATPKKDANTLLKLARWCERYGPSGNLYEKDNLWMDVTGVAHLFSGEKALLAKIRADFHALGYSVRLALASSFAAAFALSHFPFDDSGDAPVIPPELPFGQLQEALSPLPITALRLAPATVSLLQRLGLSTIGQLAALPRDTLKRRFPSKEQAKSVLLRLDQMFGLRDEPLTPLTRPALFTSRLRFTDALFCKQMLARALERLLHTLVKQLEVQHQGARHLTLTLWRADASTAHIAVGTSAPCRDITHLANLFLEKLNQVEPGFGIDTIALCVDRVAPQSARQSSLERNSSSTHSAQPSVLIDRLHNVLGAQNIGYLHAVESHIPERAQRVMKTPPTGEGWPSSTPFEHSTLATADRPFLMLEPPEAIEVMAPLPDEPPLLFTWRRVTRKVITSNGPERITPEWWREIGQRPSRPRDYYKVRTNEGSTFWLYRDGLYGGDEHTTSPPQWFMHGFFG